MDPVTVSTAVMAAIATAAAGGLKEVGKKAVGDAYEALKKKIKAKFGKQSESARAIQALEADPGSKGKQLVLAGNMEIEKVDEDLEIAAIAQKLIQALSATDAGQKTLKQYHIDAKGSSIVGIGDNWHVEGGIHVHPPEKLEDWESFYLKRLIEYCDHLELSTLEEICADAGQGQASPIRVSDVFTTLYLKDVVLTKGQKVAQAILQPRRDQEKLARSEKEPETFPIQAIEAAGALPRLVILGRPGGGKSTLVNHLAVQTARLRRGEDISQERLPGWPIKAKLLPVRIVLRRFAAWIPVDCKNGTPGLVWDYLAHQLKEWGCQEYASHLKHTLDTSGGVIFFDGLDEVREQDEQRTRSLIVRAIEEFARPLNHCRVIVTCRQYAYRQGDAWRLPEKAFPVVELDLFRSEQIQRFSRAWYRVVGQWREWNAEKCLSEADHLHQTIEDQPHLMDLAQYPLLLTLMAQVNAQGSGLPEYRADLYDRAVKLLLAHWENRLVRDQDGSCKIEQGVIARLGIRADTLRATLERIALAAHEQQETATERSGCADIAKEDLRGALMEGPAIEGGEADKVIAYIQDRAGLLQAEVNKVFRFPHRTFQEYLAAGCIMKKGDFEDFLEERVRRDMTWWQEVFLLAAGSSRSTPRNIYQLVDALLPDDCGHAPMTADVAARARLSAQAMAETEFLVHVQNERANRPGRYAKIHQRVQTWLLAIMTDDNILDPKERVAAGNSLNWVGDPRFDPDRWYLPREAHDGYIPIPAGEFWMGSDKRKDKEAAKDEFSRHRVRLPAYAIGKYPVTVAQYACFVQESGYELHDRWGQYNRYGNHPVILVSWEDAKAYCRWLTGKLGRPVILPSEAQWERAARGTDGRIYPWGDDPIDAIRANFGDTGIGETTPVGAFPDGAGPHGLHDMAGNAWEWVEDDWHDTYQGAPDNGSAWVDNPRGSGRVIRGGAWDDFARSCRAAYRRWLEPGYRGIGLGFRVALLPGQPK